MLEEVDALIIRLRKPIYVLNMAKGMPDNKGAQTRARNARIEIRNAVLDFAVMEGYESPEED